MKNPAIRSRSKRVFLRHLEEGDFDELSEVFRNSREHFRGLARTTLDHDSFGRMLAAAASDSNEAFVIVRVKDGLIVGTVNLSQIFYGPFNNAYLGYLLGAKFTGNGYMTEAIKLALAEAFGRLRLHRVEANVQPTNTPSIRVLERCGFTREGFSRRYLKVGGVWRDHERWAILAEDWKRLRTR
jgi:ribosomal-protein-alanine N-acetyltransferase